MTDPQQSGSDRVLRVNAYTTLDLVEATATGSDGWEDDARAVLNVSTPREAPEHVGLDLELDHTDLEHLPAHADSVQLSPAEAREVADALKRHAATVEDHQERD